MGTGRGFEPLFWLQVTPTCLSVYMQLVYYYPSECCVLGADETLSTSVLRSRAREDCVVLPFLFFWFQLCE